MKLKSVDTNQMKALAHPLRQRILLELNRRVASPSELAEEIGEPLGNVSYHVRMLVDLGCIELVSTTPRRGALEHHYRATVRPLLEDDTWASLPVATRRALMGDVLKEVSQSVAAAADAGSFDDENVHITKDPLTLDEQGWRDMAELLAETEERAAEISAECASRGGETVDTWLSIMHFRAADAPQQAAKPAKRKKSSKR